MIHFNNHYKLSPLPTAPSPADLDDNIESLALYEVMNVSNLLQSHLSPGEFFIENSIPSLRVVR